MESRKMILMNLFAGRNGDMDIENRPVDTVGEGESGTKGESSIYIYIQPCAKQVASENFLYNTESPAWHFDDLEGWNRGRGGRPYMYNYG